MTNTTTSTAVDKSVKNFSNKVPSYDDVTKTASTAATDYINANTTEIGKTAGEVIGGIKGISSKAGSLSKLAPTEGLLTDGIAGVEGLQDLAVDTLVQNLGAKFGSKVTVTYSDPDSNGAVTVIVGEPESLAGSLSSIITLITGLGIKPGFLQNVAANASAGGILGSVQGLTDKVGALSSASAVAALTTAATDQISQIASDIGGSLTGISASSFTSAIADVNNSSLDVANTITSGIKVDQNVLASSLGEIAGGIAGSKEILNSAIGAKSSAVSMGEKGNAFSEIVKTVATFPGLGIAQGLIESETNNARNTIASIATGLTEEEVEKIVVLSQGDVVEREEAIKILAKKSKTPIKEIRSLVKLLDTTIAGQVVVNSETSAFTNPFSIGKENVEWKNYNADFTYVSSFEELEAEMKQAKREVTEMVVHWTETYTNKNIGSKELNSTHKNLGLDGIAYHYVIRRDGSLQRGRPIKSEGQHSDINGHNKYSIGVAFVGGYNCPSGTPNPENYLSAGSLTRSQSNTFEMICRAFYLAFPGGQVLGHNDLDIEANDPGFDVIDYVGDVFGKQSLFTDTYA